MHRWRSPGRLPRSMTGLVSSRSGSSSRYSQSSRAASSAGTDRASFLLAIQDAVVASNELGPKFKAGTPKQERDLARVQRRRELPTILIQTFQSLAQRVVMLRLRGNGRDTSFTPTAVVRFLLRRAVVLAFPARLIGFGLWPPHVRPNARK